MLKKTVTYTIRNTNDIILISLGLKRFVDYYKINNIGYEFIVGKNGLYTNLKITINGFTEEYINDLLDRLDMEVLS